MDVGEYVEPKVLLHHREKIEAGLHTRAAVAVERGAVGLIVGTLEEDVQFRVLRGEGLELGRDGPAVGLGLEGAGTGDEEQAALIVEHAAP